MKPMTILKKNAIPIFIILLAVSLVLYINYKPEGFATCSSNNCNGVDTGYISGTTMAPGPGGYNTPKGNSGVSGGSGVMINGRCYDKCPSGKVLSCSNNVSCSNKDLDFGKCKVGGTARPLKSSC